jgi:hypothetical protein
MVICRKCKKQYDKYEGNFYTAPSNNSGYVYDCIKCRCEMANYTRKKELMAYEIDLARKIMEERKLDKQLNSISISVAKTIQNKIDSYSKKLYWQEDKKILADVRFCEW